MKIKRYDEPWVHYIIDNVLPAALFKKLVDNVLEVPFKESKIGITYWHLDQQPLLEGIRKVYFNKIFPVLVEDKVNGYKSLEEITSKAEQIHYSRHNPGFNQCIHLDRESKFISAVIYLQPVKDPTKELGTLLQKNNNYDECHQLKWKPNRGICFRRSEKSWHSYRNPSTTDYRYTLNVNYG
jgi:hypothetical protein